MELPPIAEFSTLLSVGHWLMRNFRSGQIRQKAERGTEYTYGRRKLKINKNIVQIRAQLLQLKYNSYGNRKTIKFAGVAGYVALLVKWDGNKIYFRKLMLDGIIIFSGASQKEYGPRTSFISYKSKNKLQKFTRKQVGRRQNSSTRPHTQAL